MMVFVTRESGEKRKSLRQSCFCAAHHISQVCLDSERLGEVSCGNNKASGYPNRNYVPASSLVAKCIQ